MRTVAPLAMVLAALSAPAAADETWLLPAAGGYACHACATVRELPAGPAPAQCPRCGQRNGWLPACDKPRVG